MTRKSPFHFKSSEPWPGISAEDWCNWQWQFRHSLKTKDDFSAYFALSPSEVEGFGGLDKVFRIQSTPYYTSLAAADDLHDPIRQIILPRHAELTTEFHAQFDPLGENKPRHRVTKRLVHRYSDRVLFLLTDLCSVYCRYCTRKHFTGQHQVLASEQELAEAVAYVKSHPGVREIIFSGGDPLTTVNSKLAAYLDAFYQIPHVELIRIGTRMPVVAPMRIDEELISIFKKYRPIYVMTHFNHPNEITSEAALALEKLVDNGVPVFNQFVLLNGINNHPAIVQALSRRLLFLRVKPYYMFQADPSQGTDHLRTSIEDSLAIQKELWGHISGLMMPNYSIDIPDGGGKAPMVPDFQISQKGNIRKFQGWDNVQAEYISPTVGKVLTPPVSPEFAREWQQTKDEFTNR